MQAKAGCGAYRIGIAENPGKHQLIESICNAHGFGLVSELKQVGGLLTVPSEFGSENPCLFGVGSVNDSYGFTLGYTDK